MKSLTEEQLRTLLDNAYQRGWVVGHESATAAIACKDIKTLWPQIDSNEHAWQEELKTIIKGV